MSAKRAEIFTSDRGLLKTFFMRNRSTNHCSCLVRLTLTRIVHVLWVVWDLMKSISIVIRYLQQNKKGYTTFRTTFYEHSTTCLECSEMKSVFNDFTLEFVKHLCTGSTERIDRMFEAVFLAVSDVTLEIVMNRVGCCQK